MTERQRKMIEAYLPTPRDPELEEGEYYVRDTADRVQKVRIVNIFPVHDGTEYDVYQVDSGRRIDSGWNDVFRGFRMGQLYDNKQDCRDYTHDWCDYWEELRQLQKEEML